jgi:rare lipoprotein A
LRSIKIGFIISFLAASAALINVRDTNATANYGATKITVSKDAKPSMTTVSLSELGVMTASWYGPQFHGKSTANGELYNQMALTAAHKSLPFGTVLQVENTSNGKVAFVRINDRGPFIEGRDLDLSKGTALALGMMGSGVIKVKVSEVSLNSNISPVNTLN